MANIGGWRQLVDELSDLCRLSSKRRREEDQRNWRDAIGRGCFQVDGSVFATGTLHSSL